MKKRRCSHDVNALTSKKTLSTTKFKRLSMSVEEAISALVRSVLPKLENAEWRVETVDRFEHAHADLNPVSPIARVHNSWLHTIYDAGLSRVERHYPLALKPIPARDLLINLGRFDLWRGVTIEREYVGGLFTRRLLVHGKESYIYVARTSDQLGASAHRNIVIAARQALSERRRKLKAPREDKKILAELREQIQQRLRARLSRRRHYDSSHRVLLTPFRPFLPWTMSAAVECDYGTESIPLIELERLGIEAVQHLSAYEIRSLVEQLNRAIDEAQEQSPVLEKRGGFDLEDWRALKQIGLSQ